ncbi:MAG: hypothetical protein Fur0043_07290 [Anaerolineales bacterium]
MKPTIVPREEKTLNALLRKARRQNVILESADGQRYVLAAISNWQGFEIGDSDDFAEEVKRTAQNKELVQFMADRRKGSKGKPTYTAAEARKQLGLE